MCSVGSNHPTQLEQESPSVVLGDWSWAFDMALGTLMATYFLFGLTCHSAVVITGCTATVFTLKRRPVFNPFSCVHSTHWHQAIANSSNAIYRPFAAVLVSVVWWVIQPFNAYWPDVMPPNCRIRVIINLEEMRRGQRDSTSAIDFRPFFDTGEYALETQSNRSWHGGPWLGHSLQP